MNTLKHIATGEQLVLAPDDIRRLGLDLQAIRTNHITTLLDVQAKLAGQIEKSTSNPHRDMLRELFTVVSQEIQYNIELNKVSNASVAAADYIQTIK